MSEVVTGTLKLTFGFLANKIRSEIAERLEDGDITDEQCRRLIVSELDDIQSKLDGLSRKNLLSSLCFLQEGINRLYQSLLQLDSSENTAESTGRATLNKNSTSADIAGHSPLNEAIALLKAITSLKLCSNDRFKSAIESFKLARENATEAFCNEALSIEDRIQASQIRMMARILENLEDPEASVSDCFLYLKQLHDIGAIQETFSVLIDGGFKSRFNKTQRLDSASSVHLMNEILFEFARKFTKLSPMCLDWPKISLGENSYRPVLADCDVVHKLKKSGLQVISLNPDFSFDDEICEQNSIVNSKGDIIVLMSWHTRTLKLFKSSGESHNLRLASTEELKEHLFESYVIAMDIDVKDNIYLITKFQESDGQIWSFKLFIFDGNGKKKLESPLPSLPASTLPVCMAINNNGKIGILNCEEKTMLIGDVCDELNSFNVERSLSLIEVDIMTDFFLSYVGVKFADFTGTNIIAADYHAVSVYSGNGQLQRKIELVEEHGSIESVAINHVAKRILVKTYPSGRRLLSFSETGELIDSLYLGSSEWIKNVDLRSHPNGPVALVGKIGAALIQHE